MESRLGAMVSTTIRDKRAALLWMCRLAAAGPAFHKSGTSLDRFQFHPDAATLLARQRDGHGPPNYGPAGSLEGVAEPDQPPLDARFIFRALNLGPTAASPSGDFSISARICRNELARIRRLTGSLSESDISPRPCLDKREPPLVFSELNRPAGIGHHFPLLGAFNGFRGVLDIAFHFSARHLARWRSDVPAVRPARRFRLLTCKINFCKPDGISLRGFVAWGVLQCRQWIWRASKDLYRVQRQRASLQEPCTSHRSQEAFLVDTGATGPVATGAPQLFSVWTCLALRTRPRRERPSGVFARIPTFGGGSADRQVRATAVCDVQRYTMPAPRADRPVPLGASLDLLSLILVAVSWLATRLTRASTWN